MIPLTDLNPKKAFSRAGFALVALFATTFVGQLITFIIVNLLDRAGMNASGSEWVMWAASYLPLYAAAIPLAYLILRPIPVSPREGEIMTAGRFVKFLLACFPIMYLGNIIGNLLSSVFSFGTAENPVAELVTGSSVIYTLVVAVVVAPFFEELLFRRLLIDRTAKYGEKTAIIFSGVAFGLFHQNLFQFFYACALGMLFAYVYVRTRQLRWSVIMHMVINFMGTVVPMVVLGAVDPEALENLDPAVSAEEALAEMIPGLLASFVYVVVLLGILIAGIVIIAANYKKLRFEEAPEELPPEERFRTPYLNVGFIIFFVLCAVFIVYSLVSPFFSAGAA